MTLAPETEAALERGRALWNAGRFYESHEAWEEAWLREEGEVRALLQGLIQAAAAYVKALDHLRPGGAVKLFTAALGRLEPLGEAPAGLALGPFRAALRASLAEAERWQAGERAAFDRALAPPLERGAGQGTTGR
jgi:predicted metal-dependent hydrolase